jgi:hypothetical protein
VQCEINRSFRSLTGMPVWTVQIKPSGIPLISAISALILAAGRITFAGLCTLG